MSDSLLYRTIAMAEMPNEKVKNIHANAISSRIVLRSKRARFLVGSGVGSKRSETTTVKVIDAPNTDTLNIAPSEVVSHSLTLGDSYCLEFWACLSGNAFS